MRITQLILMGLCGIFLASSCTKDDTDYQTLAEDASVMQTISADIFKVIDEEARSGAESGTVGKMQDGVFQAASATCATLTVATTGGGFPITLTIDFGTGCTGADLVTRKGILVGTFSGRYTEAGTVVTIVPQNYFVNDHQLTGVQTITNDGRNASGNLSFTVVDQNGIITKPDGGLITWESTRIHEWTEGESTIGIFQFCDDVYSITGSAEGTVSDGTAYTITTTSPIKKKVCCPFLTEGEILYEISGGENATLDYGDGTCDFTATLTFRGQDYVISIL